jgi:hypothetical protein
MTVAEPFQDISSLDNPHLDVVSVNIDFTSSLLAAVLFFYHGILLTRASESARPLSFGILLTKAFTVSFTSPALAPPGARRPMSEGAHYHYLREPGRSQLSPRTTPGMTTPYSVSPGRLPNPLTAAIVDFMLFP